MGVEQIHIAIAEDDPLDVMWLQTVLDHIGLKYKLTVALDGEEARDFILKQGKISKFPTGSNHLSRHEHAQINRLGSAPPNPGFGRAASLSAN
jgi:hypothetical protein